MQAEHAEHAQRRRELLAQGPARGDAVELAAAHALAICSSSPAIPPMYHLTRTSPSLARSTSRANARSSRAQAVPSGAMVASRSVTLRSAPSPAFAELAVEIPSASSATHPIRIAARIFFDFIPGPARVRRIARGGSSWY